MLLGAARSELRPQQVHLRGGSVRAVPERARAADGVAVHTEREPELAVGAAPGLLEYGCGAAGDEIARIPGHHAQPVPRTQHRQSAHAAGEVHGHRRTTGAVMSTRAKNEGT